tara:strand:+ start:16187 stop:16417 length:231 start_codon:yes stop_codon:yes gene_type:complete
MDIKSMLVELAKQQAEKMEAEVMGHVDSEEFAEVLAQKLNDKIDIPFVKEEKEGKFFLALVSVVQSLIGGMLKAKK